MPGLIHACMDFSKTPKTDFPTSSEHSAVVSHHVRELAAALVQLSGGPAAGEGASAAIYDWLGTRALPAFPPTVVNVVSPLIYRICAPKK